MGTLQWFLFVYLLGGVTFLPLLLLAVLLHAYYTLPPPRQDAAKSDDPAQLVRPDDDKIAFRTGTDDLAEQFHRKHDSDVAAGYFAVCREYVPGGVNGKPPDKLTPAGEVVAQESPSVYQTMYRSIFDRPQKSTLEPNKDGRGKATKKANNVFYVVLRHGHLMLYDDIQQLEVRYVISLEHYDVDIYSGKDETPEGELWIKRNAIRLKRKPNPDGTVPNSPPFFFFSENLSEKEDFYFALLKNQEKTTSEGPPETQEFEIDDIVKLVQKIHSSEEHLQTRWLNAMIGRLFLAMYKTPELEDFIRTKLTKKISRVKKPNFITKLALKKIDLGNGAPFVTNPRLKDLTVDGDCTVEADVNYGGNFRIEIAATARIELGSRFKPREVDMLLAVTCKRLQGHVLVRFKPPPSNRIWFSFEKMPDLDLTIEPIVSSRQITYNFILRAIESRIREVVAESVCLPFWDDIPFFDTTSQRYRGGIWKREPDPTTTTEIHNEDPEDEAEAGDAGPGSVADPSKDDLTFSKEDRSMSMPPTLADSKSSLGKTNTGKKSIASLSDLLGAKSPEPAERPESSTPRLMRTTSFASAANPTISTSHADGNTSPNREPEAQSKRESVASLLKDLSARSTGNQSPSASQAGSPPVESAMATAMGNKGRSDSDASRMSDTAASHDTPTPTTSSRASTHSTETYDGNDTRPRSAQEGTKPSKGFNFNARSLTSADRKQALASVNAAASAAQKWGWGVLARNRQREAQASDDRERNQRPDQKEPIGRGRPLPPPGIPLPPPEKPTSTSSFMIPRRKPVPPPLLPKRQGTNGSTDSAKPSPKPPLPARRKRQSTLQLADETENEVLVVEAPTESAPASPVATDAEHHDEFFGHSEDVAETSETQASSVTGSPALPKRQDSDTALKSPDEADEMRRQELGMYT
ncbi:Nucleus-vacuole junction protein 2 [Exophiala dermatitidis]|uniref:SMP-LTD domain-containing protein n=1 Tax=Exophiala dermatitidis (strain ATCC 34100 / CBS 525.76 / NIH/UT8656) TaxID=858893 RepID=H6CAV9_EXODN|nr:uncharacterized protein HMPREF1120_08850 [Exophiala dermatitidis NIH/UT8656]EHY60906.1 hypothetical protein HMPREF1120_08850 [Exophiala dermatitidis NIH/UT8656]